MIRPDQLDRLAGKSRVIALVFADSHHSTTFILKQAQQNPDADLVIHLGDHCDLLSELADRCPIPMLGVAGNCDGTAGIHLANERLIILAGQRVYLTHGHLSGVKSSLLPLLALATEAPNLADIILFGHTHHFLEERTEFFGRPVILINPGSCAGGQRGLSPSGARLTITPDELVCDLLLDQI